MCTMHTGEVWQQSGTQGETQPALCTQQWNVSITPSILLANIPKHQHTHTQAVKDQSLIHVTSAPTGRINAEFLDSF